VLEDQPLTRPPLDEVAPALRMQVPETGADLGRLTDSFHLNLTAFGLLSFAVGLFIVRGAVGLAFEQRRGVFRTLRALGLPDARLLALLAGELALLAAVAGALGIVLGWLVASALLPDVAATLRGLYGAEIAGGLTLEPGWWLSGLAIAVAGTALAGADQLWKVARLPLLAPAQPRAWARASEATLAWQAAAALALWLAAAALLWLGAGLVAGFAALGALLVGAALALPVVLHRALGLGAGLARGALGEWFWADTRQQLPGLSLALMALLLALAANIGVGTMVQSFRATFTGWLDQRLASELYVTAADREEAARLEAWLAPRAEAVLPIWRAEARVAGTPAEVYGVADHATYRDNWPLVAEGPAVWDRVAAGEAVVINEQLARREGLWPGDMLALDGWQVPVAGVYSDYGNPLPQVLVGLSEFGPRFPGADRRRFGIRVAPEEAGALARDLVETFGLPPEAVVDQAALKALSLRVFERTFTVTAALNVLTLGVAGFAILTSLLTIARMRLPQLAPLWALGLTRRRLAGLELARALLLAGLTWVAAVPVGLVLAWVLLAVINVEAFGWRLPLHLFPADWLWLLLLSLLAAGLAALWPARRLARTPPAELLKVFAHER
jgi:putative ABC transport system permease protein